VASQLNPFEQDGQQFQQGLDAGVDLGHPEGQPGQANQAGGDADLSRSLERVAAQEAWLSGPQTAVVDGVLLGQSLTELDLGTGRARSQPGLSEQGSEPRTLVVIDTGLENWVEISSELPDNADVLLLEGEQDALNQIAESLKQNKSEQGYTNLALVVKEKAATEATELGSFLELDIPIGGTLQLERRTRAAPHIQQPQ